jgi:dTDP-4-dehydrorhamnose 3,5-epimerase
MEILKELLQPNRSEDPRGLFVKTYQKDLFIRLGVDLDIREEFYSISHKNVIRGMHFQLPPHEHAKLVCCLRGKVRDVLLDLRKGAGYGRVNSAELSDEDCHLLCIPKGIAHGFAALTDDAMMLYKTSTAHVPQADCGICWDSFGFSWGIADPTISDRDQQHGLFADFASPF